MDAVVAANIGTLDLEASGSGTKLTRSPLQERYSLYTVDLCVKKGTWKQLAVSCAAVSEVGGCGGILEAATANQRQVTCITAVEIRQRQLVTSETERSDKTTCCARRRYQEQGCDSSKTDLRQQSQQESRLYGRCCRTYTSTSYHQLKQTHRIFDNLQSSKVYLDAMLTSTALPCLLRHTTVAVITLCKRTI